MTNSGRDPRLMLVGAGFIGSPKDTIGFLVEMFGRAGKVEHTGGLTRQIQYARGATEDDYSLFFGFQVDRIENIPLGMLAWDVDRDRWNVLANVGGKTEVIRQQTISWSWADFSNPARPCGEFVVECAHGAAQEFRIVSNSYIGAPNSDDILIVDYDPSWPDRFQQIKREITRLLRPISHCASSITEARRSPESRRAGHRHSARDTLLEEGRKAQFPSSTFLKSNTGLIRTT